MHMSLSELELLMDRRPWHKNSYNETVGHDGATGTELKSELVINAGRK